MCVCLFVYVCARIYAFLFGSVECECICMFVCLYVCVMCNLCVSVKSHVCGVAFELPRRNVMVWWRSNHEANVPVNNVWLACL